MKKIIGLFIFFSAILGWPSTGLPQSHESMYQYIKTEEYDPKDFTLALLPNSVLPIEKIVKYEKRLNLTLTLQRGDSSKTLAPGTVLATEYRGKYRWQGEPYEVLLYYVDYELLPQGKRLSFVSPSWIKAYDFLKRNTEEDALVLCWWHHSKRVQLFSGRETVLSGPSRELVENLPVPGEVNKRATRQYELKWLREREGLEEDQKLRDVARIFCSPEQQFLDIISKYNPQGRPLYILVSAEEFPEIEDMNRLCGGDLKVRSKDIGKVTTTTGGDIALINSWIKLRNISSYYAQIYENYYTLWYLEDEMDSGMKDALLLRLLPLSTGGGQELRYLTPVFKSDEAHVWVYKFVPEGLPAPVKKERGMPHGHP
ncbi:MAG: hypothetical protein Q6354_05670 [Candidatus Brocadiales bacterium]|nr:hypothetical protein [Candidatus Brocadiales bacterium]